MKISLLKLKPMKTFDPKKIGEALADEEKVVFALLFGSSSNGVVISPDSDIDLGIYFSDRPSAGDISRVMNLCQDAILFEKIDLAILNTATPILAFEALKGKLIYCKDREKYASFFSLTCRLYEDEMMRIHKALSMRDTDTINTSS